MKKVWYSVTILLLILVVCATWQSCKGFAQLAS